MQNSWNLFAGKVNEQLVKEIADAMVSSGMRDAGYIYVVVQLRRPKRVGHFSTRIFWPDENQCLGAAF